MSTKMTKANGTLPNTVMPSSVLTPVRRHDRRGDRDE
jgi:hypothetical protein